MKHLTDLLEKFSAYTAGDLVGGMELVEAMEKAIVHDDTNFDQAAALSQMLDQFSLMMKGGLAQDPDEFVAGCRSRLAQLTGGEAPKPEPKPEPKSEPKKAKADKAEKDSKPVPQPAQASAPAKTTEIQISDLEVLHSFILEAQDHLESIESKILELESAFEPALVNDIFRSMHTLKGVAGFLNLDEIKSLSHSLEYLLDDLRTGSIEVDADLIDILLEGRDYLQRMVSELNQAADNLPAKKGAAKILVTFYNVSPFIVRIGAKRNGGSPVQAVLVPAPAGTAKPQTNLTETGYETLANPELLGKFSSEANETIEAVEQCVLLMEKSREKGEYINEAFRAIHTLKGNAGFFGFGNLEKLCMDMEYFLDALRKGEKAIDEGAINALLEYLDQLRKTIVALSLPGQAEDGPTADASEPSGTAPAHSPDELQARPATRTDDLPKTGEMEGKYSVKKKDIRVDTDKLDALFDLIGELITSEAMVIDNPDLKGLELESFSKASNYLSKITRELQNVTMSIRMIPLEGLFSKMHRLVRDLSKKFEKLIDLDISGAETEMDRNIIEEISDPLIHIIRNAIDHGVEDKAGRAKAGKNPTGRISLNAKYEGNEIWISIKDDGRGLNRNRILEVARERGLKVEDTMTDDEVYRLIFEPGFSTAKEVSEISGRGVGMDVVRKNIEKLRGQIVINTEQGVGTEFVLRIPLTLAIIDGITLRIGEMLYSLPIADVAEFQNFNPDKVTHTDNNHQVLRLREDVIPVLRLRDFYNVKSAADQAAREVVIIAKSQEKKIALIADEIVGYKQIVLKALPEFMGNLRGISGCTILGNGEVSLIIDINSIFTQYLE